MLLVNMSGLSVAETEELRCKLAEQDVPLRMIPNRLARLALKERGFEAPVEMLRGNIAVSWGDPEAAIHAAKVVKTAPAKRDGRLSFVGGLLEGNVLGAEEAAHLASIPGRDELRAKILGCLSGPARGLVMCLAGPGGGLARVIQAHVDEGGGVEEGEG
jgi:large subunit ribosomal protein L10